MVGGTGRCDPTANPFTAQATHNTAQEDGSAGIAILLAIAGVTSLAGVGVGLYIRHRWQKRTSRTTLPAPRRSSASKSIGRLRAALPDEWPDVDQLPATPKRERYKTAISVDARGIPVLPDTTEESDWMSGLSGQTESAIYDWQSVSNSPKIT